MNEAKILHTRSSSFMLRALLELMRELDFLQNMWITDSVLGEMINIAMKFNEPENIITEMHLNKFIGKEMRHIDLKPTLMEIIWAYTNTLVDPLKLMIHITWHTTFVTKNANHLKVLKMKSIRW